MISSGLIEKLDLDADYLYPDSDGKPMSDNTEQYEWIVKIKENLEILFADNPNVFLAGDLLWYPVKSTLIAPCAPDVMVAFDRPKGYRGSYKQWLEDDIPPQVVFEILSPSNTKNEMSRKLEFYQCYGVEEYYLYDPRRANFQGWSRQEDLLQPIDQINGWVSPRLQIRFQWEDHTLSIYYPNGDRFLSSIELAQKAEQEKQRAEAEKQRAEFEKQRADQEKQRADQEKQRAERLAQRLKELGINPDELS
jgi:Uma2 family endonuclease